MAKTEAVDVPDELKVLHRKSIQQRDRFIFGVCQGQHSLPSKVQKKLIRELSLFGYLATYWRALTTTQKTTWKDAAAYSSLTNWQLFVSDNAARLRDSLPLNQPPSDLWQVRAGQIVISAPASEILLKQEHPQSYIVAEKVPGAPWKNEIVAITETFSLPLTLAIRYKSDLTATGGTQRARYYASVRVSYQGVETEHVYAIDFSPSVDWTYATVATGFLRGIVIGYTLYLDVYGYTGTLLFDNIEATHGGTNWARDPRCDDVSKEFKKAFALVPPFWVPESLPAGASFASQYPPAL